MLEDPTDTALHYTVDRFEDGGWAVLEDPDGKTFDIPATWLPGEASEGSVLMLERSGGADSCALRFTLDRSEEEARRERVGSKLARLRERRRNDA